MSTATDVVNASGDSQNNATNEASSSALNRALMETSNGQSESANAATGPNLDNKPTTSATAYSFSGNDLKSDGATDSGSSKTSSDEKTLPEEEKRDDSVYECNICLDIAKDSVISMCGHLFCWPCLHQWLQTRPNRKLCPVCKAGIDKDKVIPLYGRNSTTQEDPRNKVPPRPAGQRSEPQQTGFAGFGFDGFHMSFGIGAFPFGYFASSFNIGEQRPAAANRGTVQFEDEQELSKLFLYLAFLCIVWLLFA